MGLEYNKRIFTVGEFNGFLKDAFRTMGYMRNCRKMAAGFAHIFILSRL
ncbi:MAG TPA: hypothetical protein PLH18_00235 [Clostridia bacterium]|nr:hypothetical protein [Clostridia bacterium]